jgi:glucarate dehydratase
MTLDATITDVRLTPVAFADPPLLNAVGVHEPFALRTIVEVDVASGITGLGETYADERHLADLSRAAQAIVGLSAHDTSQMWRRVSASLGGEVNLDAHGLTGRATALGTVDRVFAPFEVACLDVQARLTGVPVCDLLGGAVRESVPFSAYLFYKWAGHPDASADMWGAALDPDGIVSQARRMIEQYGFDAIKLKGGVFAPDEEIAAIHALRAAFPEHRLRLDPNAAWSVETSVRVGRSLEGVLEYLEDPTLGLDGMAEVARQVPMPLATNMCIVSFDHLSEGIAKRSVDIVLSDHHYWGGLRRSSLLAGICDTFGLGLSMHSNSHLGISLAAMVQLAAATPNLTYACDTHWPWKDASDDVIVPGVLEFRDGAVEVPGGPGLGVELDPDAVARLHEQYLRCGLTRRDDTGYMQRVDPAYRYQIPRW